MITLCKLCRSSSDLRNSHAIPDAFFKRILSANNGQMKLLNNSLLGYEISNDSWATYQLCGNCERHLNMAYEGYSIGVLRGHGGVAKKTNFGVTFSRVDVNRICLFFISILWRAACSSHKAYEGAVLPIEFYKNNVGERLRLAILNNIAIPTNLVSIKISRLADSKVGFESEKLKDLIVAPFHRPFGKNRSISVNFVVEGFLITLIMPGVSHADRKKYNILNRSQDFIVAPYLELTSDLELSRGLIPANLF